MAKNTKQEKELLATARIVVLTQGINAAKKGEMGALQALIEACKFVAVDELEEDYKELRNEAAKQQITERAYQANLIGIKEAKKQIGSGK